MFPPSASIPQSTSPMPSQRPMTNISPLFHTMKCAYRPRSQRADLFFPTTYQVIFKLHSPRHHLLVGIIPTSSPRCSVMDADDVRHIHSQWLAPGTRRIHVEFPKEEPRTVAHSPESPLPFDRAHQYQILPIILAFNPHQCMCPVAV